MAGPVSDVREALIQFQKGSRRNYDSLVAVVSDEQTEEEDIKKIIRQLKHHASGLSREHTALISAILHLKWTQMSSPVIAEYRAFVVNLIAANTQHLRACLKMIVSKFLPDAASEDRAEITESMMHPHELLNTILKLVPLAPTVLLPLLGEMRPVVFKPANMHESYIQNLFQLMGYLPRHRIEILSMIVDHLVKLDVYSPKDEIEEQEESDDEDELFAMETESRETPLLQIKMTHKHANKLDILMDLLFKYIKNNCFCDGVLDWEVTKTVYKELLHVFDCVILPTYQCNHVQFCMFYICSFHENLHEGFIDYLWRKVIDPNQQAVFRQVAVSYIASFLARAKYVHISIVTAALDLMQSWIHRYIKHSTDNTAQPNLSHHGPFYSTCQAFFYVFIYRNRELMSHDSGVQCMRDANLQTIVTCRLNPLKFCVPQVANRFSSATRQYQLAFCDTILEKNKRSTIPVEGSSSNGASTNPNPLDSFFPFDPYILKRSSLYIEDLYQEYLSPVAEDVQSDDENAEDMWQEDQAEKRTSQRKSSLSSSMDFLEYGISPGFKHT